MCEIVSLLRSWAPVIRGRSRAVAAATVTDDEPAEHRQWCTPVRATLRDVLVVATWRSPALLGNRPTSRGSGAAVGIRRVPSHYRDRPRIHQARAVPRITWHGTIRQLHSVLPRFRFAERRSIFAAASTRALRLTRARLSPFLTRLGRACTHRALFWDELLMEIDRAITRRVSLRELRDSKDEERVIVVIRAAALLSETRSSTRVVRCIAVEFTVAVWFNVV